MKLRILKPLNDWTDGWNAWLNKHGSQNFGDQLGELLRPRTTPNRRARTLLLIAGTLGSVISLFGLLGGFVRAYNRFMRPNNESPRLHDLPKIVQVSMAIGLCMVWIVLFMLLKGMGAVVNHLGFGSSETYLFLGVNLLLSSITLLGFNRWRWKIEEHLDHVGERGRARFAGLDDFTKYFKKKGLAIGGGLVSDSTEHVLICAGTGAGKSVNMLMMNALHAFGYEGSMVYLDPKGECAAVCADYLRNTLKKNVIVLNTFDLLPGLVTGKSTYNPLCLLRDHNNKNLIDDIKLVSELLAPLPSADNQNAFFINSARNIITSLLLFLVATDDDPTLTKLWSITRYGPSEWDSMLFQMSINAHPVQGMAIRKAANQILSMMGSPEAFASVMSNVYDYTSFIESISIQEATASGGFDPFSLAADGNTVVFFTVPFELLAPYSAYLRLVVTTMMRAVVRKPGKRVTFIVDEAANLGYIREVETAVSGYRGFNLSLWLVHQDLSQLKGLYGDKWESIMANCSIRQFMNVKDVFTQEYVSKLAGDETRIQQKTSGETVNTETFQRPLITPNEVGRTSEDNLIMFVGEKPVAIFPKQPYYELPQLKDANGNNLYAPNPYVENSK